MFVLVYDPTDEDSVRATLTCLDSRTKTSSAKIILIFENLRRLPKNATRDEPTPYHRSLRFFCPYENIDDLGTTCSERRLVEKRSFERYFYSCDLTDPSSGTIVREAIHVAMKRVILECYVLTGWSPEVIRDAVRELNDVCDCFRREDTAAANFSRNAVNLRCRGDGKFIVSVQVPSNDRDVGSF